MEEDAFRPMQCDSHIPETDVTSTDKSNKEIWKLGNHVERLDEVFSFTKRAGLKCKPSKCEFLEYSKKHFGRMVDKDGIRPDQDAVEAVLN